jgi:small GTP-binding protein
VVRTLSKKVCLLGEFAVGKTSLVRRFVYDLFDDRYMSTIGVKVSRKVVVLPSQDELVELTLMLWDLAGSEEFSRMRTSYLRGAAGAVLVCDVTRPDTLERLRACALDALDASPGIRLVIAANKCDLVDQWRIKEGDLERAAALVDAPYYVTSAKTGQDVETLFRCLGQMVAE